MDPTDRPASPPGGAGLFLPLPHGGHAVNYEALDEVLEAVGVTPALVLLELGATSFARKGTFVARASERELVRQLGRWGRGFSRGPIGVALDALLEAGLVSRGERGTFLVSPHLFGDHSSTGNHAQESHTGPLAGSPPGAPPVQIPDHSPATPVSPAARLVLLPDQTSRRPLHHDDVSSQKETSSNKSSTEARAVSDYAQALDVRGRVLDLAASEPVRALGWLTYLQAAPQAASLPRYFNSMMTSPGRPFPPGMSDADQWSISLDGPTPMLVSSRGRYCPTGSGEQTRPVATVAYLDQVLMDAASGIALQDNPDYLDEVREHKSALLKEGKVGLHATYLAHYAALRGRGLLEDYDPPFGQELPLASGQSV